MDDFLNKFDPFKKNLARLLALLPILMVLLAIPLTLALLKSKQSIGSFAATGNPAPISLNPASVTSPIGEAKYFAATYEDIDGYKNINNAFVLIDTDGDGKNAFYAYYNQPANKLYLRDDNSTTWLGGYSPTTGNTISNSYFALDVANTNTVNSGGYNLVLNWKIKPLAPAGGKIYKIWLRANDLAGHDSNWKQLGSWTITNTTSPTPTPTPIPISSPTPTPILSPITTPTPTPTTTPVSGSLVGKHLAYANTFRTTNSTGQVNEYLKLGHYDFLENNAVKINYLLYDAGLNRDLRASTKLHNPMNAPYGGNCQLQPVRTPPYEGTVKTFDGTYQIDGNLLKIRVGSVTHEWRLEDASSKFYKLNKPYYDTATGTNVISGVTYSNPIGYGYLSDNVISQQILKRDNLSDYYNGDLYQNNKVATSVWTYYGSTSISFPLFNQSGGNPDVLSYSYSCPYTNTLDGKTYNTWCETSFLLNYATYSKLIIYNHGGHDYDLNGCYGDVADRGHSKQILGVMENGKITKMVWVEYSTESDAYPILGVGRYYQ